MSQPPKNRIFFIEKFSNSIVFKLTAYLVIFTILLIIIMFNYLNQPYAGEGKIEAQEAYLYAKMVESWGSPPNVDKIEYDIKNLSLQCAIFEIDEDWNDDIEKYGKPYWTSSSSFPDSIFYAVSLIEDFEEEGVSLPYDKDENFIHVQFGLINDASATAIEYNQYIYYFGTDYAPPGIEWDLLISLIAIITLVIILYLSLRSFLYPVFLMKQRVNEFEEGDLESSIPVSGQDELASLAKSVNKMTENIKILLNQKQMLLLDVSHELRTPLARMQLLLEMIPAHNNITKLKEEIVLLEGIIANLLLSDKLSTPYTNLEFSQISLKRLMDKVKKMFPDSNNQITISTEIPDIKIEADELKMVLAIRNLLDNAVKYSEISKLSEISFNVDDNFIFISVKDSGLGIQEDNISKLTKPFYRVDPESNRKGFGIGLTIVKKVIEAHKGELIIDSKYGEGSIFTLKIPH